MALRRGANPPLPVYDLNGDGVVNFAVSANPDARVSDSDIWVREIFGTEYGDANLNGHVTLFDATRVGLNLNQPGKFGWADGNFNGIGGVTLGDATIVATFFEPVMPPGAASVPEPTTVSLIIAALFAGFSPRFLVKCRPF